MNLPAIAHAANSAKHKMKALMFISRYTASETMQGYKLYPDYPYLFIQHLIHQDRLLSLSKFDDWAKWLTQLPP